MLWMELKLSCFLILPEDEILEVWDLQFLEEESIQEQVVS